MPITDKTRKILWGRSGNRCAICRRELVVEKTSQDDESVVGDECHIVSGKSLGPRADGDLAADRTDEPENLLLLCRVHHKMVDDQCETYSVELLRTLKNNHERWVSSKLTDEKEIPPVRVRRIKKNIPSHLVRLLDGKDIVNLVNGAAAFSFEHDELQSQEEADLVAGFLQEAQEWGEILPELETGERVRAAFRMTTQLQELEAANFFVFGAQEARQLEGGIGPPTPFTVAILHVMRSTNPTIIKAPISSDSSETPTSTNTAADNEDNV